MKKTTLYITSKCVDIEYSGEITEECDRHLLNIKKEKLSSIFKTYAIVTEIDNVEYILLRYPGATIGRIIVDQNNVISDIIIYDDAVNIKGKCKGFAFYDENIIEAVQQFIGCNLIIQK